MMTDLFSAFQQITVSAPSAGAVVALCVAGGLLLCSGFVSASEIAFFSLTPRDVDELEHLGHPSDEKILGLRKDSERLLATILIANNMVNVGIVMLGNYALLQVFDFGPARWVEFLVMTVLLTFLLLLFGEVMPKIYAGQQRVKFCRMAAPVFTGLTQVFRPFSSLLVKSKGLTERILAHEEEALTVDELEQALELTDKREIAEESSMLEGIIRFAEETAREIMTPRVDMVDLDITATFPEVLSCIVENNYSRIPVYKDSEDNIKGILYTKDLLPHLSKPTTFRWQSLIRPPYFVPETKMIDDLLRDFQQNKVHIAIVVDEFGGTSGIVTMEDILEEIVGEIEDEYDETERAYVRLNQNTYEFEAKCTLADFLRTVELDDDFFEDVEGEADTLAGLLLELKGEFPKLHERIVFQHLTFEIMEMDERRIVRVKVIVGKR